MSPIYQTLHKKLEELSDEGEPTSGVNSCENIQKKIFNTSNSSNFYKKRLEDRGLMPNYSKKYAMPIQPPDPKMILKFAAREIT
jgi:hypothetical protein